MSTQYVKMFHESRYNSSIDDQINEFMQQRPDYKIHTINYAENPEHLYSGHVLVVFDKIESKQEIKNTAMLVNKAKERLFDSIIMYLETPENWIKLKECGIWDGRSDDLRRLLTEALHNS